MLGFASPSGRRRSLLGTGAGICLFLASFAAAPSRAEESPAEALAALARLEGERVDTTGPDRLMDLLGVTPGMEILDIGAGTGQWSFAFARRLGGRGRVHATEIDPLKTAYIQKEARRRGLDVVRSVLVSPEGVDPFYGEHSYDLIFLSHVFYYVMGTKDYFSTLGTYLKDGGRMVVIVIRHKPLFSPGDLSDPEGLLRALAAEGEGGPFTGSLRDSTKALLRKYSRDPPGEELVKAVVDDLNSLLDLPRFYEKFDAGRLSFSPAEREHFLWLLGFVNASISYDGRRLPQREKEENRLTQYGRLIRFLNRLVIFQHFRPYLRDESLRDSVLDKVVAGKLAQEGFALQESLDLHPFNFILVFSRK